MRSALMCIALTAALLNPAFAHTGVHQVNSFASGIAHPLSGADHILTMVTIGLWSVLAGGRAMWVWPSAFVGAMLAGFAAATLGLHVPLVEAAIWSSITVLGLLVALGVKAPVGVGAATAGLFAFFHGHAHGTEAAAGLAAYAAGFMLATAGLHVTGIGLGLLADCSIGKAALRTMGGLAVLGALGLMAG
jgi:urease accessory protein